MRWHLGFCNDSYLPLSRGFDTFNGYIGGSADYFTHSGFKSNKLEPGQHFSSGYDYRKNNEIDLDAKGIYQPYLMSNHAKEIIDKVDFFFKALFQISTLKLFLKSTMHMITEEM